MSVKFPDSTPVTLPNLVRFILRHTGHTPHGPRAEPRSLLEAELRALQGQVLSLQQARERLSQQLAAVWRDNRRLALDARSLTSQNTALQAQSGRLEALYRQKSQQLADAVSRLQELAGASEELLKENSLLKVLLTLLKEREREGEAEDAERRRGKEEAS